jgi:hypothetical protein
MVIVGDAVRGHTPLRPRYSACRYIGQHTAEIRVRMFRVDDPRRLVDAGVVHCCLANCQQDGHTGNTQQQTHINAARDGCNQTTHAFDSYLRLITNDAVSAINTALTTLSAVEFFASLQYSSQFKQFSCWWPFS